MQKFTRMSNVWSKHSCNLGPLKRPTWALKGCVPVLFRIAVSIISFVFVANASASNSECQDLLTRPFFYKVTKANQTLFILGTKHTGIPLKSLPSEVVQTLKGSDLLIVERLPAGLIAKIVGALAVSKNLFRWSGPKISEQLSKEAFAVLRDEYIKNGKSPDMIDLFTPVGALFMGAAKEEGQMDQEIQSFAKISRIRVEALESERFQRDAFFSIFKMSAAQLEKTLLDDKAQKEKNPNAPSLAEAYRMGDEELLWETIQRTMVSTGFSTEASLDNRNEVWVNRLRDVGVGKKVFVAVGAAHLFGDQGLLKLMKSQGYEVERVVPGKN